MSITAVGIHRKIAFQILMNITILWSTWIICDEETYRGVVFPPATVLQFAIGLAVPAQVPNRSVFTNLGTISNIPLPSTIRDLYPYIQNRRALLTHDYLYKMLAEVFNSYNLKGTECVSKTICQMSRVNIDKDDLTESILEYLFVPSTVKDIKAEYKYLQAEQIGRYSKLKCADEFADCEYSLIDLIADGPLHEI